MPCASATGPRLSQAQDGILPGRHKPAAKHPRVCKVLPFPPAGTKFNDLGADHPASCKTHHSKEARTARVGNKRSITRTCPNARSTDLFPNAESMRLGVAMGVRKQVASRTPPLDAAKGFRKIDNSGRLEGRPQHSAHSLVRVQVLESPAIASGPWPNGTISRTRASGNVSRSFAESLSLPAFP